MGVVGHGGFESFEHGFVVVGVELWVDDWVLVVEGLVDGYE